MMRRRIPGAVLMGLGAAMGAEATTFDVTFLTDPVGPKALPMLAAVTLVLAGLHAMLRPSGEDRWPTTEALGKVALAVAAFLAYALALGQIGFFLSTTAVVAVLARLYGADFRRGVPAAAALSGVLWLLFVRLLALPLPIGELWIL